MQRRTRPYSTSSRYHVRGAAAPRVRRNSRRKAQLMIRRVISAAVALAIILLIIYGITLIPRSRNDMIKLGFQPGDPIQSFGDSLLFLNKGVLTCVASNGGVRWPFPLGEGAGFHASGRMITAWSGNRLCIINAAGEALYDKRLSEEDKQFAGEIQFARIGATYVAVVVGSTSSSVLLVKDHMGVTVETIDDFPNAALIDCGFFDTQDLRLWTIAIDLMNASPTTLLNTYEPRSRASTGNETLMDQLVYHVYTQNKWLMLVNNVSITAYDYNCRPVAGQTPVTIYGWQLARTRAIQNDTLALMTNPPAPDGSRSMRALRLISRGGDQMLRLPEPVFDALLGSRSVYAFMSTKVYVAPYGQTSFTPRELPIQIDQVLDMLEGNVAVLASGADVYLYKLPEV